MIVVLGATGQVGSALARTLPGATFLSRRQANLSDPGLAVSAIAALEPSAVINAAAYTAVDQAEDDEGIASMVNGVAVGALAGFAADAGIPFVTYSTDYVFDGSATQPYVESSPTGPIGAYGRSKLIGEWLCTANHPQALVIRTSWVISATHDNFITAILRRALEGDVRVVDDQVGRPTVPADLATATVQALRDGLTGVAHLTNEEQTTWFQLARAAVDLAGIDPSRVHPCTSEEFPTRAKRPTYSVLGTERSDLPTLPPWRESLPQLVREQIGRIT